MATAPADSAVIERVYAVIESRRGADPNTSNTARLFNKGTAKIAQKVGEEAVEALIEAMRGDVDNLVEESADLIYHLLVLWADQGVKPDQIWAALAAREGMSMSQRKAAKKAKK